MIAPDVTARFACPVHWCEGNTWTHGGDDAMPDEWLHESASIALPGGMTVHRRSTALDPDEWTLHTSDHAEIAEAASPDRLAALLDAAAAQLRRIASDPTP
ncbi:hypothetical protein [Microbacterium sp. NPDC077057]|uniref:hypothetical protein n=1 Tax=unclassified Microbacterium TaxID=2609290 RepID=UPI00343D8216